MIKFYFLLLVICLIGCKGAQDSSPVIEPPDESIDIVEEKDEESETKQKNLESISVGNISPEGSLLTPDSLSISTNQYKGKLLIIDFWATWCSPCIDAMPKFKELEGKYENSKVEFITVSVDDEFAYWKDYLKDYNWSTDNYWLGLPDDQQFLSFILSEVEIGNETSILIALPKYVVISPDGLILNNNAPHPTGPAFEGEVLRWISQYAG